MTNPFDPSYLGAASSILGPFAWAFLVLQAAGIVAGLYLLLGHKESNVVRKKLFARLGLALLVAGGIGIVLGVLRGNDVALFNRRYWFYLLLLAELGLAGYVVYFARTIYPRQLAQSQASRGKSSARPALRTPSLQSQSSSNGRTHADHPESVSGSSRRESRQRRKRKRR